ncbi:hypothetical protein STSP2_03137 [Anaerohalosphaera lusitana]|uniref:Putative phage metallopeptidase domain-containing protein n=1 Tax=Anaerohalosphaera lusitana TaxID=1936003 RepID=A0A1U9NQ79_9BACT|nr:putative metallopeptidase [Anaerohalosphaera lusitana]AQT69937.1 hypothetical protein STSP2_03137 [Anaerohalosphaera lusitana]
MTTVKNNRTGAERLNDLVERAQQYGLTGQFGAEQYRRIIDSGLDEYPKNVPYFETVGWHDSGKSMFIANERLRRIAQNLIDCVPEHRHLQEAKILLLVRSDDGIRRKLEGGKKAVLGKGVEAREVDFVVWISGDWLDRLGVTKERGCEAEFDGAGLLGGWEPMQRTAALIDHELLHCGAKILGEFVRRKDLEKKVERLGAAFIEVCEDIVCEATDSVLVRFYDVDGGFKFCMRKHDVEEFHGVACRHGSWNRQLGRLVDAIVHPDPQKELPLGDGGEA